MLTHTPGPVSPRPCGPWADQRARVAVVPHCRDIVIRDARVERVQREKRRACARRLDSGNRERLVYRRPPANRCRGDADLVAPLRWGRQLRAIGDQRRTTELEGRVVRVAAAGASGLRRGAKTEGGREWRRDCPDCRVQMVRVESII